MRILSILLIAITMMSCQAQNTAKDINTEEFIALEQEENVYVIDVRTPGEVEASYISLTDYFFNVNDAKFKENIASLDKDKTYIVYCRSGARSTSAINYMEEQGFTNLYELSGGILSWKDEKLLQSK